MKALLWKHFKALWVLIHENIFKPRLVVEPILRLGNITCTNTVNFLQHRASCVWRRRWPTLRYRVVTFSSATIALRSWTPAGIPGARSVEDNSFIFIAPSPQFLDLFNEFKMFVSFLLIVFKLFGLIKLFCSNYLSIVLSLHSNWLKLYINWM